MAQKWLEAEMAESLECLTRSVANLSSLRWAGWVQRQSAERGGGRVRRLLMVGRWGECPSPSLGRMDMRFHVRKGSERDSSVVSCTRGAVR